MARHVPVIAVPAMTTLFTQPPAKLPFGTSSAGGPLEGTGPPGEGADGESELGEGDGGSSADGDGDGDEVAGAGDGVGEGVGVGVGGATAGDGVGVAVGETVGAPRGACAIHEVAKRAISMKSWKIEDDEAMFLR